MDPGLVPTGGEFRDSVAPGTFFFSPHCVSLWCLNFDFWSRSRGSTELSQCHLALFDFRLFLPSPIPSAASGSTPGPGLGDRGCRDRPHPTTWSACRSRPQPLGEYPLQPRLLGWAAGSSQRQDSNILVHFQSARAGGLISRCAQGAGLSVSTWLQLVQPVVPNKRIKQWESWT